LGQSLKRIPSFNLNKIINNLVLVISFGVLANLIFLLITNEQNIWEYLSKIKFQYLALILLCLFANWLGHSLRLMIWTRYLGQGFKLKEALRIAVFTELGAALTPTLIGGGPIKLALLIKNKLSTGKAGFLTLLNGLEDFIMYCTVLVISFFHARESILKILASIGDFIKYNFSKFVGILMCLVIIIFIFRRIQYFKNFLFIPQSYRKSFASLISDLKGGWSEMIQCFNKVRKDGLAYLLLSLIVLFTQWTIRFSVLLILLTALDIDFEVFQMYIQQWIVYLTMIFIPTPGASGGAEATFYLIFEKSLPKDLLPLITSTWRFFMYYLMLFFAVFIVQFTAIPLPGKDTEDSSDE
jgi:uncharacterized protein (TIRG00374 family)